MHFENPLGGGERHKLEYLIYDQTYKERDQESIKIVIQSNSSLIILYHYMKQSHNQHHSMNIHSNQNNQNTSLVFHQSGIYCVVYYS